MARKIIVFEGIDGTGKTTQAKLLENRLNQSGIRAKIFPFGDPELLEGAIRKARRNQSIFKLPQRVQILLVAADFYACMEKVVRYNGVAILDRYWETVLAYHIPKGISAEWIKVIYQDTPKPDAIILLDAPVEEMAKRKAEDINALNIEQQEKARQIYLVHFGENKINALLNIEEIYREVWERIKPILRG